MITEDYVSFEITKLLREKGFSENTICKYADVGGITEKWYDDYREKVVRFDWEEGYLIEPLSEPKDQYEIIGDTISAPTLQMVMKWLREIHKIHIVIYPYGDYSCDNYQFDVYKDNNLVVSKDDGYITYEQACKTAIKYCLENLI